MGGAFRPQLHIVIRLALGLLNSLLLIADSARWIRSFFLATLAAISTKTMLLDWQHLHQKGRERASRICRGREVKQQLLQRRSRRLWQGKVAAAIAVVQTYRSQARNVDALDTFIA